MKRNIESTTFTKRLLIFLAVITIVTALALIVKTAFDEPKEDPGTPAVETINANEPPATIDPADNEVNFAPKTVSFDPDSQLSQKELEDVLFAAVQADFSNLLWCWEHADVCDLEKHLGPAVAEPRLGQIKQIHDIFIKDGALYERDEIDAVYAVEILASSEGEFTFGTNNSYRLLGAVVACEVFGGPYFVPASGNTQRRIIDDGQTSYMTDYRVWQQDDGTLKIGNRSIDSEGPVAECDPFKS